MSRTLDRIPPHLRRFVIQQAYDRYTAVDQAVWRFVLLQMYEKLQRSAHQAYRHGLARTGISVERIPSIREMDDCLGRFGWGAVCVDGFIPPRAFTEFQAAGLLPICAEIRTADHLVYTPAPDIIHEAAGHAPILVDQDYADYIKRIGEVGARAFSYPEDRAVYDAIYNLSEVKERPSATQDEVAAAELELQRATANARATSEATLVSRLYWWTAEYGLIGSPDDYKLYGAGLLSSLGESHSCQDSSVQKLPLSLGCTRVGYDITRAQPQLFVAESFAELGAVLDELASTLAYRQGGRAALLQAFQSKELCTLTLDTGVEVIGEICEVRCAEDEGFMLARVVGRVAFANAGRLEPHPQPAAAPREVWVLIGASRDGVSLRAQPLHQTQSLHQTQPLPRGPGQEFEILLGNDSKLQGRHVGRQRFGSTLVSLVEELMLTQAGQPVSGPLNAGLVLADRLLGARAGVDDPAYYPSTDYPETQAPLARSFSPAETAMMELYQQALRAHRDDSNETLLNEFSKLHMRLKRDYPDDWLLRWNLLESLVKRNQRGALASELASELARLEHRHQGRQPILSGLKYLGY